MVMWLRFSLLRFFSLPLFAFLALLALLPRESAAAGESIQASLSLFFSFRDERKQQQRLQHPGRDGRMVHVFLTFQTSMIICFFFWAIRSFGVGLIIKWETHGQLGTGIYTREERGEGGEGGETGLITATALVFWRFVFTLRTRQTQVYKKWRARMHTQNEVYSIPQKGVEKAAASIRPNSAIYFPTAAPSFLFPVAHSHFLTFHIRRGF